jgi:putative addiction module component (TIGR02574 family)
MRRRTTPCTELHGRYRRPKELAKNAKNPGKTRVFERRGQEPNFFMFSQCFKGSSKGTDLLSFKRTTKQLLGLVRVNTLTFKDLDVTINSALKRKIEWTNSVRTQIATEGCFTMNVEQTILEIATLPIDVRLRLVSAIWDTLPQDADVSPSALQQAELDRRLSEHRENPGSAISHEEIMRRVKSRR